MIWIDLVMVTPPKPPGSRQLISPPVAVLEMAPAKVLHGAVRLQGLASLPTPDTQVRVACAWAVVLNVAAANSDSRKAARKGGFDIGVSRVEMLLAVFLVLLVRQGRIAWQRIGPVVDDAV